ncbi:PhzF family phenazine biosynthesis protein [Gilvibacter sp.]|uniref:PhzF family phenazine biosynthesis protein n=1 Tax=Gilvibacter sp. TaxID=2729997 RepID=UPI003F4A2754
MELEIYQVDAFTDQVFGGNPAAVVPLKEWLDEQTMLKIAQENNLAETAYFVQREDHFEIRWFMPHAEIDLCGHATLASAFVIFEFVDPSLDVVHFSSQSGPLSAKRLGNGSIQLDFPTRKPEPIAIPQEVFESFNYKPLEAHASRDLILLFESEDQIRSIQYELNSLKHLPYLGIVPTAKGDTVDFVSRVFDAVASMPEDPVTGSTHASLIPFWSERLGKNTLLAHQLSERGGVLYCEHKGDRVDIAGHAVLYLKGKIYI